MILHDLPFGVRAGPMSHSSALADRRARLAAAAERRFGSAATEAATLDKPEDVDGVQVGGSTDQTVQNQCSVAEPVARMEQRLTELERDCELIRVYNQAKQRLAKFGSGNSDLSSLESIFEV